MAGNVIIPNTSAYYGFSSTGYAAPMLQMNGTQLLIGTVLNNTSDVSTIKIINPNGSTGWSGVYDPGNLTPIAYFGNQYDNVGIGTSTPSATVKLDVAGATKLGVNGTTITNVIKSANTVDVASVAANSSLVQTFAVANTALTSTVYVSPATALADGLVISYARVSVAGTVEVKFRNTTGSAIDPPSMTYYITVIE